MSRAVGKRLLGAALVAAALILLVALLAVPAQSADVGVAEAAVGGPADGPHLARRQLKKTTAKRKKTTTKRKKTTTKRKKTTTKKTTTKAAVSTAPARPELIAKGKPIDLPCQNRVYTDFSAPTLAIFEDEYNETETEWMATWNGLGRNVERNPDGSVNMRLLRPPTRETTGTRGYHGRGAVLTHRRRWGYGRVSATLRAGPRNGPGVVLAFITMSPNHDEIDFEWTLGSTQTGEFGVWTNWFKGGVPTDTPGFYGRGGICRHPANLRYTFVKYDFEWTRDRIRFLLNDRECYRVNRADPANRLIMPNGTAVVMFPTEPPNIQFGIWDGGGALSAPGTREWAGGATQWLTEPNASQGFGMTIRNVTVTCY